MIEPAKRRLTLLFTLLLLAVVAVAFSTVSAYYHYSLRRYLESQLAEEMAENLFAYAAKDDLPAIARVMDTELFQVLNADGKLVVESMNPLDVDPPVNRTLVRGALTGRAETELVRLGNATWLVAYAPLGEERVGRAVASADVLRALERTIATIAALGFPVTLLFCYGAGRLLVARVLGPIRDMITYQELFAANIAHEVLSPLTALKGGLEVALRRERPAEELRTALTEGLKQTDRVVMLLSDLQLLATAGLRRADLLRETVWLDEVLTETLAERRDEAASRGLLLAVQAAAPVPCLADRALVRRVMENLLDNALHYAPPPGPVTVDLRAAGRKAVLRVSNPCAPLPRDARARLFEPFARGPVAQRGAAEGRGLGLYIARHIARSHGGDLELRAGGAAQFTVVLTLPRGRVGGPTTV